MYLIIRDDGSLKAISEPTEDDFEACEVGIIRLVDMDGCEEPRELIDGQWQDVES